MKNIYQNIFNIKNKNILLVGANGFLGQFFSELFSNCEAKIFLADIEISGIKKKLKDNKKKVFFFKSDISKKNNCKKIVETAIKKMGNIDIFINCAAKNNPLSKKKVLFENYKENFWKESLNINLNSALYLSQYVGKHFVKRNKGKIIFIGSHYSVVAPDQSLYLDENGKQTFIKSPDYVVSKFGLIGLTKYLASYYSGKNITTNILSPTSIKNQESIEFQKKFSTKTPLRRMSNLKEYAGPILFLCSDSSSYVNGFNLLIDGGLTTT